MSVDAPGALTDAEQSRLPWALPGGKAVLFTVMPDDWGSRARVEAASLPSGARKILIEDGADNFHVSSTIESWQAYLIVGFSEGREGGRGPI